MKKLKVMTLVGTRPEVIKLSRVIAELDQHTDHVLVHSGQNYDNELNEIFFKDLDIRAPDHCLNVAGDSVAETIGKIISKTDEILDRERPDAFLIYGDTNTCLGVIAAKKRKIPIFHMEAGNRCFDQRVPEELNRKIVDHVSDVNMPLTEHARRYLLAEGLRPETIIKTGSVMREVLSYYSGKIERSNVLDRLKLKKHEYFVVSAHREETVDVPERLSDLLGAIESLVNEYKSPVIVSTHPRTRKRLQGHDLSSLPNDVQFLKPLGFLDYVKLQKNARCVLSDSGTITEEAALLNLRAVMIREAHERPEGMDAGSVIMCGLSRERVLQSVATVLAQSTRKVPEAERIPDYESDNVSQKVVRIILSYVDYVNRTVWRRL